jgi:ABC-type transport system involved in multi-copper enzyme maturation permease subunit
VTTIVSENRRARVLEYVPWMARDYMTNQGPATAIVALLFGVLTIAPLMQGSAAQLGNLSQDTATRTLSLLMTPIVFIGVLFATNGIVANDRKLGYYRFLFAKPVGPPAYYATTFLVNGIGFLLVCVALLALWSATVRPMFPVVVFLVILIMYLAYGGVGFLLSAAWRFDWLSLVTVLFLANVGWSVWGTAAGPRRWFLYLLPPVHRANDVYSLVVRDASQPVPWGSIAWLTGYGVVCFVLGLIVIRRRPLGTS